MSILSGFIHNSPKVGATQILINRRMGNKIVAYSHNEISLRNGGSKLSMYAINIKLKNITLSERSQTLKNTYGMNTLISS